MDANEHVEKQRCLSEAGSIDANLDVTMGGPDSVDVPQWEFTEDSPAGRPLGQ